MDQLTDQQRDEILAALARLTTTVQATAEAVAQAFAPAVQAVAQQFAELQKALAPAGPGPRCCVCGTTEHGGRAFYENYRRQLFCWPCADGDPLCNCHQPPVRQSQHVVPVSTPSAKDDGGTWRQVSEHLRFMTRTRG